MTNPRQISSIAAVKVGVILGAILAVFVLLLCFLPLNNAVQIGADEGYELAKATLSLKGYKMYTEVWNDQPPLHTYLISEILKHITPSIAGPRLLSSALAVALLGGVFYIGLRLGGLLVASVAASLLLAAPIFLELGSSCMVEIPAMAPAVIAIALIISADRFSCGADDKRLHKMGTQKAADHLSTKTPWLLVSVAGVLLGISFQIKFINIILLPLIALVVALRFRGIRNWFRLTVVSLAVMGFACGITFFVINQVVDGQGFMVQFRQSWSAHFAAAQSFEYGSPADHPFDWKILLRHWDTAIPALVGLFVILKNFKSSPGLLIAGVWLVVNTSVFAIHKPWWSCYYLHIAVPLSLCAALGVSALWRWACTGTVVRRVLIGFLACSMAAWAVGRIYLETQTIRSCPQTHAALFLEDTARYKPYVQYLYAEEPVYSFHSGIPMPPEFAVVALKRLWSGDMTNEKINARLTEIKPGLMLLSNDGRVLPFNHLLATDYQMIYQDQSHRLYVLRTVAKAAREHAE